MGKALAAGEDRVRQLVAGTFSGVGVSDSKEFNGLVNFYIEGAFTGSIQLEYSLLGEAGPWLVPSITPGSSKAIFTAPDNGQMDVRELGFRLRFNCTALTAGTPTYRISN